MALMRNDYETFEGLSPGMIGLEDCESLFTRLKTEETITAEYSERHLPIIQRRPEQGELGNIYWLSGMENPAVGLTKVSSDMASPLR